MSGHSKWSTIKHKKAAADAKRGNIFTKMANAIAVATKTGGGGDPEFNFSLRLAIEKAKAANMPKDKIEKAVLRGLGQGGAGEIEEIVMEGYGPGGVPIVVVTMTDNRNRTVSEVKFMFEKRGGSLGEPGSVVYQFDILSEVEYKGNVSEQMQLELIDYGVGEFEKSDEGGVIWCELARASEVVEYLEKNEVKVVGQEMVYKAQMPGGELGSSVKQLIEELMEHDDVQGVFSNEG